MKKLIAIIGIILVIAVVAKTKNVIAECVPPPADLISWWPGDGNANDIADENDGTLMGDATFAPGLVGQAFLLDGSIDDFVDLGNASNLHVSTGDFTVDAWVNFTSLQVNGGPCNPPPGCDMSIVDKMSWVNHFNDDGWRLLKHSDNRFWFCLGGKDGNHCGDPDFTVFSQTVATTGVWYHVAVVKNSAGFSIYVNGVLEDSRSPLPDFQDSNSTNLIIGSYIFEGANLNGLVDEVEIYNRALSQAEIQAIYDAGSEGKCTSILTVVKDGNGSCTVTSSPSGIDCGSDCSEYYPENTEVTLSVSADPGSVFGGWSGGGCSGTDECVVSMTTSTTVTFTCNLVTYEVTAWVTGGHGVVTPPVQTINHGESATININPDEHYYIASITDNGIVQRIVNPYVIPNVTEGHTVVVTFEAYSGVVLLSPNEGDIFEPCSMIASYQPAFNWASGETLKSYTIKFSISSSDFETRNNLILSTKVSGTKYTWKPDLTSWLTMMRKSYNRRVVRDIYWKVIGKRSDGTEIESAVWGFRVGPAQAVTLIDPPDALDSGVAPTLSFNTNCNVKFMLEFSPLADFSDPKQVVGFPSSRKDPNADPIKDHTLTWDQWMVVKKRLGAQGYFRIRAWDAINRETPSEIGSISIDYYLVGGWEVGGRETVSVVLDGRSAKDTVSVYDQFTFYLDRRKFTMIGLTKGKWKELPNNKYTITFPYDYLASYFERQLEGDLGVNVSIRVTSFSMGGTEKRQEDTIKGRMSLKMSIDIPSIDASGTISIYVTFTGDRMSAGYLLDSQESLLKKSPLVETLGQYLKEMVSDH